MDQKNQHKISQKRLDELANQKVKALDVVFALALARIEMEDMVRISMGGEPLVKRNQELYDKAMNHLHKKAEPEDLPILEKAALANITQASFLAHVKEVLKLEDEELQEIIDHVELIEVENVTKENFSEKFKNTRIVGGLH